MEKSAKAGPFADEVIALERLRDGGMTEEIDVEDATKR
jgi:hypothetical protein